MIKGACWTLVCIVTVLASVTDCYRILAIFPHPGRSHWVFFRPVVAQLAENGHNVTVFSYFAVDNKPESYREFLFTAENLLTNSFEIGEYTPSFYRYVLMSLEELTKWGHTACRLMLTDPRIQEIVDGNEGYDVILTELFHTDCALGIGHVMNVPVVAFSSSVLMPWHYDRMGAPDSPSFIPSEFVGFSEKMPWFDRLANFVITKSIKFLFRFYQEIPDNEKLRQRFGDKMPDIKVLHQNVSLFLINQHFSMCGSRPLPPGVIEAGGLHLARRNPELSQELSSILDRSKNGVILMSFGSIVALHSLPVKKRNAYFNVFRELKETVIMKWEIDQIPTDLPSNVILSKWLPQLDILRHPNVKLFISHGGLMGMTEAVSCGVPMIVTPMYGDQYLNAATLANRKAAVVLDYSEISEKTLKEAIDKCLTEEFQNKAKLLAVYLNDRLYSPLDTAIWAIENVVRTGGNKLAKPYSVHLNWFTYYSLDAISILVGVLLVLGFILKKTILAIVRLILPKKQDKVKTN